MSTLDEVYRRLEEQMKVVYQLKIVLLGFRPQIMRRVQVPALISLDGLHGVIQDAMGWTNSHLHMFLIGTNQYSATYEPGDLDEMNMLDERNAGSLADLITEPRTKFLDNYDFGDDWDHEITFERAVARQPAVKYSYCLLGKRACPPEDCGGTTGYAELLKVLQNPTHPEYKEMRAWAGRRFDPEAFDLQKVNKRIQRTEYREFIGFTER